MNQQIPLNNFGKYNTFNQYNAPKKIAIPKVKNQNLVNKNYNSQKKSTAINYMKLNNSIENNKYHNNTFNGFNLMEDDFSELPNNYKRPQNFNMNKNFKKKENKVDEIQERFDELQNKLKNIQNIIAKTNPKYEPQLDENNYIFQNKNDDYGINTNNYNNNFNFNNKQNIYNPKFAHSYINKNFNNNIISGLKDLNQIHNQMQNRNPRASLIKKMTKSILNNNKNNFNNNINNVNNLNNINNNLKRNQAFNNNNINNSYKYKQVTNQNNIINNNNKIINKNNNFDFAKNVYKGNSKNQKNLNNLDLKNYPHEIQQIQDYNKSNFILNNNNQNNNNNKYILPNNNIQINKNNSNNYNQFLKFNNNIDKIDKSPFINLNKEENDDNSNSDNLSDIAEDLFTTFNPSQDSNNIQNNRNSNNFNKNTNNSKNNIPNFKEKLELNQNNLNNIQFNYKNDINYKTQFYENPNLTNNIEGMNLKNLNNIYFDKNNNNIIQQNIKIDNSNNFIDFKNNKGNINKNQNNINNYNENILTNQKKTNLINNDIGEKYIDDSNDISLSKDQLQFLKYFTNPHDLGKSIPLSTHNINENDDKKSSNDINDKKNIDIKINNINYQQNQISNSNIIVNVSYSKDGQIQAEKSINKKEEISDIKVKLNPTVTKQRRRIRINLDENLYYHYQKDSSLEDLYQVYNNKNKELPEKMKCIMDLDDYMKLIKGKITPKPCIKPFNEKEIKMNEKYLLAENLKEEDIIPDLYEEDEEDIKSLGQSLEKSIDKIFVHSLNEKINDYSINDSNISENINDNSNNNGKKLVNDIQNIIIEDEKGEEYTYEEEDEANEQDENYDNDNNNSDDN